MNLTFAFIVLTVFLPKCYLAEPKLDKRVVSDAIARLSKEDILGLQSKLVEQLSVQGQNISTACLTKMGKLLTTEIAQAFQSNVFTFYIAKNFIGLQNYFRIDEIQI